MGGPAPAPASAYYRPQQPPHVRHLAAHLATTRTWLTRTGHTRRPDFYHKAHRACMQMLSSIVGRGCPDTVNTCALTLTRHSGQPYLVVTAVAGNSAAACFDVMAEHPLPHALSAFAVAQCDGAAYLCLVVAPARVHSLATPPPPHPATHQYAVRLARLLGLPSPNTVNVSIMETVLPPAPAPAPMPVPIPRASLSTAAAK